MILNHPLMTSTSCRLGWNKLIASNILKPFIPSNGREEVDSTHDEARTCSWGTDFAHWQLMGHHCYCIAERMFVLSIQKGSHILGTTLSPSERILFWSTKLKVHRLMLNFDDRICSFILKGRLTISGTIGMVTYIAMIYNNCSHQLM